MKLTIWNFILLGAVFGIVFSVRTNISIPQVIVSPYAWFDLCDLEDTLNPDKFGGVEFSAVRDAFNLSGYVEGVDFVFKCMPWPDSTDYTYAATEDDNVLGVFLGLPINAADIRAGYPYSQETLRVGYGIGLMQKDVTTGFESWFFIQPFEPTLYAVMLSMPILFGIIVWIFQSRDQNILNYIYHFVMYYFKLDFLKFLVPEARLIEFFFQIYCAVIITFYTSQMTTIISLRQTSGGIQKVSDLRGLQVVTDPVYMSYTDMLGARTVELEEPIQLAVVDDFIWTFLRQDVKYFLFETAVIEGMAKTDCRFTMVMSDILITSYGILWSKWATEEMRQKIDIGLMNAFAMKSQEQRLAETAATQVPQKCFNAASDSSRITINDVYGLWIAYCLLLGMGCLIMFISYLQKKCFTKSQCFNFYDLEIRGKREKELVGAMNSQVASMALISQHMIKKSRKIIVKGYTCAFSKIEIPLRAKIAMLHAFEADDSEFKEIGTPKTKRPSKTKKDRSFSQLNMELILNAMAEKKKEKSILMNLFKQDSVRALTEPMNQSSSLKKPKSYHGGLKIGSKKRKRESLKLVSNLSDSLSKFVPQNKNIHIIVTPRMAEDIASHYLTKSAIFEFTSSKLKTESSTLPQLVTKKPVTPIKLPLHSPGHMTSADRSEDKGMMSFDQLTSKKNGYHIINVRSPIHSPMHSGLLINAFPRPSGFTRFDIVEDESSKNNSLYDQEIISSSNQYTNSHLKDFKSFKFNLLSKKANSREPTKSTVMKRNNIKRIEVSTACNK